jgi:hypothetical protein
MTVVAAALTKARAPQPYPVATRRQSQSSVLIRKVNDHLIASLIAVA